MALNRERTVFVVDEGRRLMGAFTEGDALRAYMSGQLPQTPLVAFMQLNPRSIQREEVSDGEVLNAFVTLGILALPVVDSLGSVVRVILARETVGRALSGRGPSES